MPGMGFRQEQRLEQRQTMRLEQRLVLAQVLKLGTTGSAAASWDSPSRQCRCSSSAHSGSRMAQEKVQKAETYVEVSTQ